MSRPTNDEWKEYEQQILDRLNIAEEWKRLVGIEPLGEPNANGWIKCRAYNREDNTPSAGICVSGEKRGNYRDLGAAGGGYTNLFTVRGDLLRKTWKEGRDKYAEELGIKKPGSDEKRKKTDSFAKSSGGGSPVQSQYEMYSEGKPGVSKQSLVDIGVLSGTYPSNWKLDSRTSVFAAPMFGGRDLADEPPTGYHLFSINPARKIRKFSGKDKPIDEVKTLTLGEYGLMGLDGLLRLKQATHVWVCEGLSDLLAVQSVLDKSTGHVVVTGGGCNQAPKPHWIEPHFIGKTVYVCFDVGDADDQGQKGAAVWCGAMNRVAKEVRNVALPVGQDGSKNDLRAWIVDGKRTYADMLSLAALMPVWKGASSSDDLSEPQLLPDHSPHLHLLDRVGCIVSGQIESTSHIAIHSVKTGQRMVVKSLNAFGLHEAQMMFGVDVVASVVSTLKEPEPGKVTLFDLRTAIAAAANGKVVSDGDSSGGGVWPIGDDVVLVGKNFSHRYTTDKKLLAITKPVWGGRRLDYSSQIDWYTEDMMQEMLHRAEDPEWRKDVAGELLSLFAMWNNWEYGTSAEIAAGLVFATFVQTCWEFRPHVCITGPSNSGKTMFIDKCIPGIFNGLCASVQKATEAGLRQKIGNTAVAVAIDEFEADQHRPKVLELLRTSTRGGKTPRGTAGGKAQDFGLKHIAWVSAIEVGLTQEADQNRFIRLALNGLDSNRDPSKRLRLPTKMSLSDLGHRASACAIYTIREAKRLVEQISSTAHSDGVSLRYIESLAVPASMLALNFGWPLATAVEWVQGIAVERQLAVRQTSDEEELIEAIQSSKTTEGGRQFAISSLVESVLNDVVGANWDFDANMHVRGIDADRMLQGNGIRVLRKEDSCFIHPKTVTRFLLQNTRFAEMAIGDILERVPGAVREHRRIAGHPKKGVKVPMSCLFCAD